MVQVRSPLETDPLIPAVDDDADDHAPVDSLDDAQNDTDSDSTVDAAGINGGVPHISERYCHLRVLDAFPENEEEIVPLHENVTPRDMASSFWEDCKEFRAGSMPHSTIIGVSIGVFCGLVAYVYYFLLELLLEFFWRTLPEEYFAPNVPEEWHWVWIPLVGYTMALGVGLSIRIFGEPGDLSYTVQCVHDKAYISMDHVMPMLMSSQFSILGGGSLGPEAPLVAICASFSGYISRKVFKTQKMNIIRKHTLMGMSCALAAFFGVPLGGSLFALEINNRFGIEYYEHVMEAIFSGTVCLCVFRGLTGLDLGAIWSIEEGELGKSSPLMVLIGAGIGLLGAAVAWIFSLFHKRVMALFKYLGLLEDGRFVRRSLCGATVMLLIGTIVPRTMFWGEAEFQTIATTGPASELPHVWPTDGCGLLGLEMDSFGHSVLLGVTKMIAVSFTVSAGYRGGFIFPFFAAGAAFGVAITFLAPDLSRTIATLCFAAGINVAITRTALATTLILCALAGEINAGPPVLAASMVSLFVTSYMPFIRSQVKRADIILENSDKLKSGPSTRAQRMESA